MTFTLLQDETMYVKKKVVTGIGEVIDGVYYPPTAVESYVPFYGRWEPISGGKVKYVLPEGLQSSYSIMITTEDKLKEAEDIGGANYSQGSVVYLSNPDTDEDALPFDVFKAEEWVGNAGFTLLNGHNKYICVRREKR